MWLGFEDNILFVFIFLKNVLFLGINVIVVLICFFLGIRWIFKVKKEMFFFMLVYVYKLWGIM